MVRFHLATGVLSGDGLYAVGFTGECVHAPQPKAPISWKFVPYGDTKLEVRATH